MGYSISAPLKSAKARDEMLAFMEEHYRSWCSIEPPEDELQPRNPSPHAIAMPQGPCNPDYDWTAFLCRDGDLSYDNGKNRLGFNYGVSHGPFGDYGYSILRWMALRAGRVRTFKKKLGVDETVPHIVYDGYEAWPVLERSVWEDRCPQNQRWCLVDRHGFKPIRRDWMPLEDLEAVPRKLVIHEHRGKEPILEMFKRFGVESVDWLSSASDELDELPAEINGTDPTWMRRLFDELQKLGAKVTIEKGPFVLDGWRKDTADAIEHAYAARERVIHAELERLTALWEAR